MDHKVSESFFPSEEAAWHNGRDGDVFWYQVGGGHLDTWSSEYN